MGNIYSIKFFASFSTEPMSLRFVCKVTFKEKSVVVPIETEDVAGALAVRRCEKERCWQHSLV